jgi:hypothetical protein
MFEAKGVAGAAERLTLVVGDVRQPFPQQAQQAQVRLPPHAVRCTLVDFYYAGPTCIVGGGLVHACGTHAEDSGRLSVN